MRRTTIIIILVVAAVAVAVAILFALRSAAPGASGPVGGGTGVTGVTSPPFVPPPAPTSTAITIGTTQGVVATKNFYTSAAGTSADRTVVILQRTSAYVITYYVPDGSFNIFISQLPYETNRAVAEAALISLLGVSQADACKLNVTVGTSAAIDPAHAGTNEDLSFCPGTL